MTPEAQQLAIAEWCGWTAWDMDTRRMPDYLNDLNAIHCAEEQLKGIELSAYCELLLNGRYYTGWADHWPAIHATAAQRAEALLRTIGKWEGQ